MSNFTPWSALLGGAIIGLAVSTLYLLTGRMAAISGILGTSLTRRPEAWRFLFIIGLPISGLLYWGFSGSVPDVSVSASKPVLIVAGVLVGYGTRLGSGCTSGHGICGLARLSRRSLTATLTFMVTGAITVFLFNHIGGGTP